MRGRRRASVCICSAWLSGGGGQRGVSCLTGRQARVRRRARAPLCTCAAVRVPIVFWERRWTARGCLRRGGGLTRAAVCASFFEVIVRPAALWGQQLRQRGSCWLWAAGSGS